MVILLLVYLSHWKWKVKFSTLHSAILVLVHFSLFKQFNASTIRMIQTALLTHLADSLKRICSQDRFELVFRNKLKSTHDSNSNRLPRALRISSKIFESVPKRDTNQLPRAIWISCQELFESGLKSARVTWQQFKLATKSDVNQLTRAF